MKILTYIVQNNIFEIKNKHLIFKNSIAEMKTCVLVDNDNKAELIDKFFVYANKISIFKLEKPIKLILENSKIIQKFTKKAFVNIIIKDYIKQLVY